MVLVALIVFAVVRVLSPFRLGLIVVICVVVVLVLFLFFLVGLVNLLAASAQRKIHCSDVVAPLVSNGNELNNSISDPVTSGPDFAVFNLFFNQLEGFLDVLKPSVGVVCCLLHSFDDIAPIADEILLKEFQHLSVRLLETFLEGGEFSKISWAELLARRRLQRLLRLPLPRAPFFFVDLW